MRLSFLSATAGAVPVGPRNRRRAAVVPPISPVHPTPHAMEFFEFVLVLSITVLLPLTILKTVMDYKKSRLEAERGTGEAAGVTVGELKRMLAEVVREANAPLVERIEELERERDPLPPAGDLFVGADENVGEGDEAEKTLGRRVRG